MDIEELSTQQTVLLSALVSFVTAIATGIVTVSLLEQTPTSVTAPVNRVVERTVERVVPSQSDTPKQVTKKKTVVVKRSNKITEATNTAKQSLVRIYADASDATEGNNANTLGAFKGFGVLMNESGLVVTDNSIIADDTTYQGVLGDDTQVPLSFRGIAEAEDVAVLGVEDVGSRDLSPVSFADDSDLQVGQQVIALAGQTDLHIRTGIISQLQTTAADTATSSDKTLSRIQTSINPPEPTAGAPLVTMPGKLVGVYNIQSDDIRITPMQTVKKIVANMEQNGTSTTDSTAVVSD